MQLREWQSVAIAEILRRLETQNVLLKSPTGAGKTVLMNEVQAAFARKGFRCITVVRRRLLVDQASRRMKRDCDIDPTIFMAGRDYDENNKIAFCSIDTVRRRPNPPAADLIVLDEAHEASSDSYIAFLAGYPNARVLGVTATPFPDRPLTHVFTDENLYEPITHSELIKLGYLVKSRVFACKNLDLSSVKITAGEYNNAELSEAVNKAQLVGDIVETWIKHGEKRPTICFATSIEHSQSIHEKFALAGVTVAHVDANTHDDERARIIDAHETGEIKIITNVGILGIGADLPWVSCIIQARPTKSKILHIQQLGRGTRICGEKKDFIVLDHANNVFEHGFIEEKHAALLTGKERREKSEDSEPKVKHCEECFAVVAAGVKVCPECGYKWNPEGRVLDAIEGELTELSLELEEEARKNREEAAIKEEIERWQKKIWPCNLKYGTTYRQIESKYGKEAAKKYVPFNAKVKYTLRPAQQDPSHPFHGTDLEDKPASMEKYYRYLRDKQRRASENRPGGVPGSDWVPDDGEIHRLGD